MSTLDVDLGNSRIKYRCGAERGALAWGAALPIFNDVTRVRVSSVMQGEALARFRASVTELYGCNCELACASATCAGVRNGYDEPQTLGVDRWLAVLAAYHHVRGAALVVDLGTAATLDIVTAQGTHLGGFIVPGLALMRRALTRGTAAVRFDQCSTPQQLLPGRSTQQAVERGLVVTLVHLIQAELERAQRLCQHSTRLVLCGGDAELVAGHLDAPYEYVPDLVLDGLALALP